MSRSKSSISGREREAAIEKAELRRNETRRAQRKAHERMKRTGDADDTRAYIEATRKADRAENAWHKVTKPRDTGWSVMPTSHGPRYHREIGAAMQLDVEMQVTTWIGSAVLYNVLVSVSRGHMSAAAAAAAIEDVRAVRRMPLPEGDC